MNNIVGRHTRDVARRWRWRQLILLVSVHHFTPPGGGKAAADSGCTFRDHSTMEEANQWTETNSDGKLKKASRTSDISTHLTDVSF